MAPVPRRLTRAPQMRSVRARAKAMHRRPDRDHHRPLVRPQWRLPHRDPVHREMPSLLLDRLGRQGPCCSPRRSRYRAPGPTQAAEHRLERPLRQQAAPVAAKPAGHSRRRLVTQPERECPGLP